MNKRKTFGIDNEKMYANMIEQKLQEYFGKIVFEFNLNNYHTFLIVGSPSLIGNVF